MALKTFNLNEETHKAYAEHCKKEGISMSKKVENFIKQELELIQNPEKILKGPTRTQLKESIKIPHSFSKYC